MTDEEILTLYFQRDENAIEQTRIKYGAYCGKIAARILSSNEDREECMNDALLRLWNAIPPQRPGNFKLYLAAIVRNLSFSRYRKLSAQSGTEVESVLAELAECVQGQETPEEIMLAKDLGKEINLFLGTLRPQDRKVFLRRYFFTESTREIAKRYGLRESSVRVSLSRTRSKLKQYLKQGGYPV